jgi:hypothetical protein
MPEDSVDQFLTFEVDFFTYKDPRETPELCGCLLSTIGMGGKAEVSKEQIKECYVKAVRGGPSQRTALTRNRSKMTKKRQRQLQKKYKRPRAVIGRSGLTGNPKENQKKFLKKMRQKQNLPLFPRRSRRDVSDQNMNDYGEVEDNTYIVDFVDFETEEYEDYLDEYEEDYEEIEDDEFTDYDISSGWDFL